MKIEFILIGVIALVFLVDFILKGHKKKKTDSVDLIQDNEDLRSKNNNISFKSILIIMIGGIISGYGVIIFTEYFTYDRTYSISKIIESIKYGDEAYIWNLTFGFIGFLVFWLIFNSIKTNHIFLLQLVKFGLKRKKNISLFIAFSIILKILIHFFIYPIGSYKRWESEFGVHVDAAFKRELWLFLPSLGILLFIVWLLGDKIKAR